MRQPVLIILLSILSFVVFGQTNYIQTAEDLITAFKEGEPYEQYVETLRNSTFDELREELDTDDKRFAFWINIYNGYIQVELRNNPELYDKRNKFFATPAIKKLPPNSNYGSYNNPRSVCRGNTAIPS